MPQDAKLQKSHRRSPEETRFKNGCRFRTVKNKIVVDVGEGGRFVTLTKDKLVDVLNNIDTGVSITLQLWAIKDIWPDPLPAEQAQNENTKKQLTLLADNIEDRARLFLPPKCSIMTRAIRRTRHG